MKQKELTLKLTLAIVALTSLSAATSLIVPTYATTTDDGSDTTTTTGLADIVNRTTMMIPSEEDIRDLFTGAITDALQQNIQIVQETSTITIPAGSSGDVRVSCQGGAPLTGGGFDSANENLQILRSFPLDGTTWQVSAIHEDPGDQDTGVLVAYALCLVVSE
jgi:hypothetical protein